MVGMQPRTEYGACDFDHITACRRKYELPLKRYPKRICEHPGCTTPLNPYHDSKYCHPHERLHRNDKPPKIEMKPADKLCVTDTSHKYVTINIYQGEDAKLAPLRHYQSKMDISRAHGYNSFTEAVIGLYKKFKSPAKVAAEFGIGTEGIHRVLFDLGFREKQFRKRGRKCQAKQTQNNL